MRALLSLVCVLALMPFRAWGADVPTLKVGAILPLSGAVAFMGQDVRDGFLLCAKDRVPVVFEDHQTLATNGVSAFNKLVNVDKINFGLVSFSNVSQALLPIARSKKIPLLLTIVSAASVAKAGGASVLNFFTTGEQEGPVIANYFTSAHKVKKAAILYMEGDFGLSYDSGFSGAIEAAGEKMVARESFMREDSDFRAQLTKIKASGAEVLEVVGYDNHMLNIVRQAKELGLTAKLSAIWSVSAPIFRKGNEALLEGVYTTAPSFYFNQSGKLGEFYTEFEARFGRAPSAYAGIGCDTAELLASLQGESPAKAMLKLRALKDYVGIMGKLSSSDGLMQIPLYPVQLRNGELVPQVKIE